MVIHTNKNDASKRTRINNEIDATQVQLIGVDGKMVGTVPMTVASTIAQEVNLDLVEVNGDVNPPIVKVADYSKIRYKEQRKHKAAKVMEIKDIRIRPNTGEHDLEVKAKAATKFLDKGHPLRITIMLRGRENGRRDNANDVLYEFASRLSEHGTITGSPSSTLSSITLTMQPVKKRGER